MERARPRPGAYRRRIGGHLAHPGLEARDARDSTGQLLGVAYGWTAGAGWPDDDFHRALTTGLGAQHSGWLSANATFEVAELMVSPSTRRTGLGRRLLSALCGDHPLAWLATHPGSPATDFYRRLGRRRYGAAETLTRLPLEVFVLEAA